MREIYSLWCAAAEMNCAKWQGYELYQKREKARGLDWLETELPTYTHIYTRAHIAYMRILLSRGAADSSFSNRIKTWTVQSLLTRDIWGHTALYNTVVESCITQHQCTVGTQGSRVLPVDRKSGGESATCSQAVQLLSKSVIVIQFSPAGKERRKCESLYKRSQM